MLLLQVWALEEKGVIRLPGALADAGVACEAGQRLLWLARKVRCAGRGGA